MISSNLCKTIELLKSVVFEELYKVISVELTTLTNYDDFNIIDYTNGYEQIMLNDDDKKTILEYCINNTNDNILIMCEFDERVQYSDNFDISFGEYDNYSYEIELKSKATLKDLLSELSINPIYGYFEGFNKLSKHVYSISWGT
jgi:hypothetical protein